MSSSVLARSATSSSASGFGSATAGSRVRAIPRAAWVRFAIGCIARRASANPARNASAVPPSTPSPRKSWSLAIV
jgi:hypothetical protein